MGPFVECARWVYFWIHLISLMCWGVGWECSLVTPFRNCDCVLHPTPPPHPPPTNPLFLMNNIRPQKCGGSGVCEYTSLPQGRPLASQGSLGCALRDSLASFVNFLDLQGHPWDALQPPRPPQGPRWPSKAKTLIFLVFFKVSGQKH